MIVVGSPTYIAAAGMPHIPQELVDHRCINLRLPTRGGLYAWEFEKDGREVNVRVDGQCIFNGLGLMVDAALAGFGFAFVPQGEVEQHVARGALVPVLEDWCPSYPGLSPLLSKSAPTVGGFHCDHRGVAVPALIATPFVAEVNECSALEKRQSRSE